MAGRPQVGSSISIEDLETSRNRRRNCRYCCWRGVGTGAGGGGKVAGAGAGMRGGKQKSTLSPHIQKDNVPACTLIFTPAVARNGRPRMIGIWGFSSISTTKKSHGMTNSPTLTEMSSRMPTGCLVEHSAS